MESLKLLLVVLMSLIEIRNPEQEVPQETANNVVQLLTEVRTQRGHIEEIARILNDRESQRSQPAPVMSPIRQPGVPTQLIMSHMEQEEWELEFSQVSEDQVTTEAAGILNRPLPGLHHGVPSTSPTTSRTSMAASRQVIPQVSSRPVSAPMTVPFNPPAAMPNTSPVDPQNSQIAMTSQALELWGNKRVSWGKKHPGARFAQVYEEDGDYLTWIMARSRNATPQMQDFIMYINARRALEQQAGGQ